MILIGQYDSSFVRRVGIALTLYGIPFEHRPWSTFGEADKIGAYNPLFRVPTLVLDDGDVIVDSYGAIDHIDRLVPADKRMLPAEEPERHRQMRIAGLATGLADKAVSLFYERVLHKEVSDVWVKRCRTQIAAVLDVLERERAVITTPHWFGDKIGHADVAVAASIRHVTDSHPDLIDFEKYPALTAHCAALEALAVFKEISQPFIPPA